MSVVSALSAMRIAGLIDVPYHTSGSVDAGYGSRDV